MESFSIVIANKIFHVTVLLLIYYTNNMVFSDEDKILIKSLYLKKYTAKRLTDEFSEKIWPKHGVNKLLKKVAGHRHR